MPIRAKSSKWDWYVQGYYSDKVKYPKVPGDLVIEVGGLTKEALDMDITVLQEREDIGEIILIDPYGNETSL